MINKKTTWLIKGFSFYAMRKLVQHIIKSDYNNIEMKKTIYIILFVLIAFLTGCKDTELFNTNTLTGQRTMTIKATMPIDESMTRSITQDAESLDILLRWEVGNSGIKLVFKQGENLIEAAEEVSIKAVEQEGRVGTFDVEIPLGIDVSHSFDLYGVCTRLISVKDGKILAGVNERWTVLPDYASNNLDYIPVWFQAKNLNAGDTPDVGFRHLGSLAVITIKNETGEAVEDIVVGMQRYSQDDPQFYYESFAPFVDLLDINKPVEYISNFVHQSPILSLKPNQSTTYVHWIRPNGNEVPETVIQMGSIRSVNTLPPRSPLKIGHAYHVYAVWDGNKLTITDMQDQKNDRFALVTLFSSLNGNQWDRKDNWCSDKPLGEWYGITLDENGFVTKIELEGNNLSGILPPEIGNLSKLRSLFLGWNYGIYGVIPAEIGKLKELRELRLLGSELTGGIPEELYSLSELEYLYLGQNNLSGELSPKIGQLSKLSVLWIPNNNFTGSLPKELGQLTNLTQFGLYSNSFSGSLPDELGSLNNAHQFKISHNNFSGTIPMSILKNPNIWDRSWVDIISNNNFDLSDLTHFPALNFTFNDVSGLPINLGEEYKSNKYTIIYNWMSWSPEAIAFHPTLITLYNQYKDKGLEVIGLSSQDQFYDEMGMTDQMLKEIADDYGMPWRTAYIQAIRNFEVYGSWIGGGACHIHVVDENGSVVFSTRAFSHSHDNLRGFLEDKLGKGSDYEHNYYASTDYSADGKVETIQAHTAGSGIKLIFTGDAFTDKDHANGVFDMRVNQAMEAFFSEEPYTSLRNRFDVYSVAAVSKNKEIAEDSETAFGTFFGTGTFVGGNDDKVFEYALKIPGVDMTKTLVTVIANSPNYSGTCFMYYDNAAIVYCPIIEYSESEFAKVLVHESGGHGFGKLLDEYAYSGSIPADEKNEFIYQRDNLGWGANVDVTSNPEQIQWSFMLNDTRYKDVVGIHEGGLTYAHGAWRPTFNSIMRNNTDGFNAPSRFAIYKRIIRLSEGREATFEEFAQFDAPNLAKTRTKSAVAPQAESFKPTAPPVFIRGSWKDAGK